jgi:hypothetical protein
MNQDTTMERQDGAGVTLCPPDMETLMEWEAEGGCQAAASAERDAGPVVRHGGRL